MHNALYQGYEIERADGTRDEYFGWNIDEIRNLEKGYHGDDRIRFLGKVYEIENDFHKYTYNWICGVFRDYNEPSDEITELNTDDGIAHYLWNMALKADEDSAHAYKSIAIDIFEDFDKWRAYAFMHKLKDFERDANYLKEVIA